MKPSSAKNKGRKFQQETIAKCLGVLADYLEEGDIQNRPMGSQGNDWITSPKADRLLGFDVECKHWKTASVWEWIEQDEVRLRDGFDPLVLFKLNRTKTFAIIPKDTLNKRLTMGVKFLFSTKPEKLAAKAIRWTGAMDTLTAYAKKNPKNFVRPCFTFRRYGESQTYCLILYSDLLDVILENCKYNEN